jgi:hypothetical protein
VTKVDTKKVGDGTWLVEGYIVRQFSRGVWHVVEPDSHDEPALAVRTSKASAIEFLRDQLSRKA